MKKKTNKPTKRRELSGERKLALALVEVIEEIGTPGPEEKRLLAVIEQAEKVLAESGYAGLESITSRVNKIETQLIAAINVKDGKEVSRLGAELSRAQRGLPPLAKKVEKKVAAAPDPPARDTGTMAERESMVA